MWAFTGFSSNSATLKNPNEKKFLLFLWDNTARLLKKKREIYARSKLYVVAVSDWIKHEIEKSVLGNQTICRIYNGIDTETFKPYDKNLFRKELGLPLDKKIIAFGIKGWADSNKVADDYADNDDVYFAAIGHAHMPTGNKNCTSLPKTQDRDLFAKYLSAADIFLHPTPEDSFGLISAEALSCGVPVVTYDIDALPEIVTHKHVGYVAEYENVQSLKAGIDYVLGLSAEDYARMSARARERIKNDFSCEKMYDEYLSLYKKILAER